VGIGGYNNYISCKKTSNSILTFEIELLVLDIAKKLYCFYLMKRSDAKNLDIKRYNYNNKKGENIHN